jgi:signal transduction histidine kinase
VSCEDIAVPNWEPTGKLTARPLRSWLFDLACAALALGVSLPQVLDGRLPLAAGLIAVILLVGPLTFRRIWPVQVFGWVALLTAAVAAWNFDAAPPAALAICLYTVAATSGPGRAVTAAVAVEAGALIAVSRVPPGNWALAILTLTAPVAALLAAGLYIGARRAYLAELHDRASRLERERDQHIALAAAMERERIAREMHDSVAHHLTVIVALADGALAAVGRAPDRAAEAMRGVSSTAREALAEARRLLGVLRPDSELEPRQPLPGLADLDDLMARVRAAGLPVRYERSGVSADPPPGVQLAVFRLVQEALTNTMKHAGPGASAAVRLEFGGGEVRVEVEDDGLGSAAGPQAPGGGLTGMRERVGAFGGELDCGQREPRGWRVAARLQLDHAAAS